MNEKIIDAENYHPNHQAVNSGNTVLNRNQNKIIDADAEQEIWEDYLRHGCKNAFPSKVIIA